MHIEPGLLATLGQKLKLDNAYYVGVVTMVSFWLLQADIATPLATLAVLWLIGRAA